ncbi:C40 family peptidase [Nonomuraea longicatena]|uniref:NlpC/P60 domain-containing protein n=1 Tax=Nonomuraea longicatena TaxID=83682 RepID=A0ABN1NPD4_9ACTN
MPRSVLLVAVLALIAAATVLLVTSGSAEPPQPRRLLRAKPPASTAPQVASPPAVAALGRRTEPHLLVVADRTLGAAEVERVRRRAGVRAVEVVDAARTTIGDRTVGTFGVEPSTFRGFTPKATAAADGVWRSVASGEVVVSFGLGTDGGLVLGSRVRSREQELRVGAYATMGLGAVDAVVSRRTARRLGLPSGNALLVSAPRADWERLRGALAKALGAQVAVLKPRYTSKAADAPPVPEERMRRVLAAAGGKLGAPYVWGAEGPDAFDCSGLIQWAFLQAGIRLPRVTHQQFAAGPQVPFSRMRPGDLIFWRLDPTDPGYISHAAIYWGDGKMIQAPRTGDVVKIVPVHARNLAGVVRISG